MEQPTPQVNQSPPEPTSITNEFQSYKNKRQIVVIGVIIVLILLVLGLIAFVIISNNAKASRTVNTFEDCVAAGNPVMESYPRQCRTSDGKLFVEEVDEVGIINPPSAVASEDEDESETSFITIYFSKDPESYDDPTYAFPVERDTDNEDLISFVINELIAGPTTEEMSENLFSELVLTGMSNCDGNNYTYELTSGEITVQFCKMIETEGVSEDARIQTLLTDSLEELDLVDSVVLLDLNGDTLFSQED